MTIGMVGPEDVDHGVDYIYQERPGEFSWRCRCGAMHKHQQFGTHPRCMFV